MDNKIAKRLLVLNKIENHPCYSEVASHHFARIHLPVAPACNISCNFCNRRYDCVNESRPGVSSTILSPEEAVAKVIEAKERLPQLYVAGIAGPGDPLANPSETFATFRHIREAVPNILCCLSTNGLNLSEYIQTIMSLNISHVTITINAVDPKIGSAICKWVRFKGKVYKGIEAGAILIERQIEGISMLKERGVACKVNSVLIPGINDYHLPDISQVVRQMGAYLHNLIPYIPCKGTPFYKIGIRPPLSQDVKEVNERCGGYIKMMRHCRQCRADATGFLWEKDDRETIYRTLPQGASRL